MKINYVDNVDLIAPGAGWERKDLNPSDPTVRDHNGKVYNVIRKYEKNNKAALIAVSIIVAIFAIPTLGIIGALFFIPGVLPQRQYYAIPNQLVNNQPRGNSAEHDALFDGLRKEFGRTPAEREHEQNKNALKGRIATLIEVVKEQKALGNEIVNSAIIDAQEKYREFKEVGKISFENMTPEELKVCADRLEAYEKLIEVGFEEIPPRQSPQRSTMQASSANKISEEEKHKKNVEDFKKRLTELRKDHQRLINYNAAFLTGKGDLIISPEDADLFLDESRSFEDTTPEQLKSYSLRLSKVSNHILSFLSLAAQNAGVKLS